MAGKLAIDPSKSQRWGIMDLSGRKLLEDAAVGPRGRMVLNSTLESDERDNQPINYRWQVNTDEALAGKKIRGSEF